MSKWTVKIELDTLDRKSQLLPNQAQYMATVEECPGLFTSGANLSQLMENLADAICLWWEASGINVDAVPIWGGERIV